MPRGIPGSGPNAKGKKNSTKKTAGGGITRKSEGKSLTAQDIDPMTRACLIHNINMWKFAGLEMDLGEAAGRIITEFFSKSGRKLKPAVTLEEFRAMVDSMKLNMK